MVIDFLKWVKGAILDKHFHYSLAILFSFILLFGIDVTFAYWDVLNSEYYEGSYITAIASFIMIYFISRVS